MQVRKDEQPDAPIQPGSDPMVVIGIKGDTITAKNNQWVRTRNYADWKLQAVSYVHGTTLMMRMLLTRTKS